MKAARERTSWSTATRRRRGTGLRMPAPLVLPAALAFGFLVLPLAALMIRAPWSTLLQHLRDPQVLQALRLSLVAASVATAICLALGVPLAWLLARVEFPGRRVLRALVTVPMVLPPVVGGLALLLLLSRTGVIGKYLYQWFDLTIPFTTTSVIIAESFVAMPFLVIAVEGALRGADDRYEEAAATLGAGRWTTFRRVTLPLVAPGIGAGGVLCFARALGEFGATITFAGSFPGRTQTTPMKIYLMLYSNPAGAIVLSLVLVAVSVVILASLRDRWLGAAS